MGIDARGILKVTHMLNLQSAQHESMEVSHPLASLDSQVRVRGGVGGKGGTMRAHRAGHALPACVLADIVAMLSARQRR